MSVEVGFGSAIITPPTPVQLAGLIEDQPATEAHDDLEVRAMFLPGAPGAVCLLVCDLLGMSPGFARPIRTAVAEALGWVTPAERADAGAIRRDGVRTATPFTDGYEEATSYGRDAVAAIAAALKG